MKNIAYKISQNCFSLPDGFVTEYYSTDDDLVEDYLVVTEEQFQTIILNNDSLLQTFLELKRNEESTVRAAALILQEQEIEDMRTQQEIDDHNKTLFNQFLIWKNALDGYI